MLVHTQVYPTIWMAFITSTGLYDIDLRFIFQMTARVFCLRSNSEMNSQMNMVLRIH